VKPYASTAALADSADLWERLGDYRRAGLTAVELGAGVRPTSTPIDLESLATSLRELEVSLLVHNYFPPQQVPFFLNLASRDDEIRARSVKMVEGGLTLSARLGASHYSVHGGWVTDPTGVGRTSLILAEPIDSDAARTAGERFAYSVDHLLALAESLEVDLLIENNVCSPELVGKVLLASGEDFDRFLLRFRSERLGILVDLGHLRISAETLGFTPEAFVDEMAPHIRAFHAHDNDGKTDLHEPVQEGSWALGILRRPEFVDAIAVDEARFVSAAALARHVEFLAVARAATEIGSSG